MIVFPEPFLIIANSVMLAAYTPLNRRRAVYYLSLPVDRAIPLLVPFVIPYVLYFLVLPVAWIFIWLGPFRHQFLETFLLTNATLVAAWAFFPTGVHRPRIPRMNWAYGILQHIYRYDGDTNALPSGHVAHSVVVGHFLFLSYPSLAGVIAAVVGSIVLSTVFTKQHYLLDVLAGLLVAGLALAS